MPTAILFDPDNQALLIGEKYVQLAPKIFGILRYLHQRPQTLVSKEELLEAVWPGVFVTEAVLKVTVGELRKLLGDDPKKPQYVQTVHRRGYRFIGALPLAGVAATEPAQPFTSPPVIQPPEASKLIGRQQQWQQLEATWQLAQGGQQQILFIAAEAGMGKTTLLNHWLQQRTQASGDQLVVTTSCFDQHGNSEPYLPILEALGSLLRSPHSEQLKALLQQYAPGWLAQFPALLANNESESLQQELFGATPQRMLREFVDLVATFSQQIPLLLCIEDLHWCDTATVDLLVALANRREGGRFLLVGTLRPSAMSDAVHPLKAAYTELTLHQQCQTLELPLLQQADLATWLTPHLPDWLAVGDCLQLFLHYTQGNPLFVQATLDYLQQKALLADTNPPDQTQALKLIEEGISGGLMQLLNIKIGHLDKAGLSLLEAASIPADECVTESLATMLEQDVLDVEEACAAPPLEHWLTYQGERHWPDGSMAECYQFRHNLYRQFFHQRLSAARRRRYHLRFAERLLAGFQGSLDEVAAKLAYHFESGGDIPQSIEFHQRASQVASQRFAFAEAIQHVSCVIELAKKSHRVDSRVILQAKERRCLFLLATGKLQEVIADYQSLIQASQQENAPEHELRATLGLADALFWVDRQACLQTCQGAAALAQRCAEDKWQIHAQGKYAHLQSMINGYRPAHQAVYEAALAMAHADTGLAMKCIHYPRYVYYLSIRSRYAEALQVADEAKEFARQAGDANSYLGCEFFRAWALFYQGKWGAMLEVIGQAQALAGKNAHHLWLTHFQLQRAWLLVHLQDDAGVRQLCLPIYEQARQGPPGSLYFFSLIILILAGKAEAGEYVEEITVCLEQQPQAIDWVLKLSLFQSLTEYAISTGNQAQAQDYAQQLEALAATSGEQTYALLAKFYQLQLTQWQFATKDAAPESAWAEALAMLQERDLPVVSWRLYALAEDWDNSTKVLQQLLDSLASAPAELRANFANSAVVSEISKHCWQPLP